MIFVYNDFLLYSFKNNYYLYNIELLKITKNLLYDEIFFFSII